MALRGTGAQPRGADLLGLGSSPAAGPYNSNPLRSGVQPALGRSAGGVGGSPAGGPIPMGGDSEGDASPREASVWQPNPNHTYQPVGGRQSFPARVGISPDGFIPLQGVLRKNAELPPVLARQIPLLKQWLTTGAANTAVPSTPVSPATADVYVNQTSLFLGFVRDKHPDIRDTDLCLQLLTNVHYVTEFLENECARESGPGARGLINKAVTGASWANQGCGMNPWF